MAAGDLVQSAGASGTDPTAVFGASPTAGNTLIAVGGHRQADEPVPSMSGWTLLGFFETQITNSSYRHGLCVFGKQAGVSEPTGHQLVWTPSKLSALTVREFEGTFDLTVDTVTFGDSGATDISSVFTGTTATPSAADSLAVSAGAMRRGSTTTTWTDGFVDDVAASTGAGTSHLQVSGASLVTSVAVSSTWEWSDTGPASGATAAILVLSPAGSGGGETASGGSSTTVDVTAAGAGSKGTAGGAGAAVTAGTSGDGSKATTGGAAAGVTTVTAGAGAKHTSGGSGTVVTVAATGGGTRPAEAGTGGSGTTVVVTASGAGGKHAAGGSSVTVTAVTIGAGVKASRGGDGTTVNVTATGAGVNGEAPPVTGEDVTVTVEASRLRHAAAGPTVRTKVSVAAPSLRLTADEPALRHTVTVPSVDRS